MGQLWCNNCLEEIENYPCSRCGYAPTEENQIRYALTGHVLAGRYLVGRILGQGGFGITYLGMDMKLQTRVAIKEFYPSGHVSRYITMGTRLDWNHTPAAQSMRSNGVEVFLKEAQKMSKVSHIPNVVGVQDVIQENDTAYIIMSYISGTTLKDILAKNGSMDWNRAKEIFLPTIKTMAQVHKAGLVHRDISPDNLIIQADGQVQILDLGAAKDISVDGGLTSVLVAKAGFSPLEQYGVTGKSGTWTDVYAMAATIYYTVTGVLPQTATDRLDRDTLRWDLPRLQNLPKPVLSGLKDAMAIRASDRTQTMQDFLAALEAASGNAPSFRKNSRSAGGTAKKKILLPLAAAVAVVLAVILFMPKNQTSETPPVNALPQTTQVSTLEETLILTTPPTTQHVHSWKEASYNDPKTCTTCGATEGSTKPASSSLSLRDIVSSANASSVYSGDDLGKHGPENMYDGNLRTNWTENASGNGVGESTTFYFDDTYALKELRIYIGSHFNEGVYRQNCRPKVITLAFSDGSTESISLEDSYDEQIIAFDQYHYTNYVKLTIDDIYTGTQYLDTAIAELDFVAYRP